MSAPSQKADYTIFYAGMIVPFLLAGWVVPAILLRTWVITMLWAWYIVPGFGLSPLRMSIAFGLSVIVAMLSPKAAYGKKEKSSFGEMMALSVVNQLLPLTIGWIGSFFV